MINKIPLVLYKTKGNLKKQTLLLNKRRRLEASSALLLGFLPCHKVSQNIGKTWGKTWESMGNLETFIKNRLGVYIKEVSKGFQSQSLSGERVSQLIELH